jgi:hypothetical protein
VWEAYRSGCAGWGKFKVLLVVGAGVLFDFECRKSDRSKEEVTSKGRDGKMRHVKLRVGILKSQVV